MRDELGGIFVLQQQAREQGRVVERRLPDGTWIALTENEDTTGIPIGDLRLSAYVSLSHAFSGVASLTATGRGAAGRKPTKRAALMQVLLQRLRSGAAPESLKLSQGQIKQRHGVHRETYYGALADATAAYLAEIQSKV